MNFKRSGSLPAHFREIKQLIRLSGVAHAVMVLIFSFFPQCLYQRNSDSRKIHAMPLLTTHSRADMLPGVAPHIDLSRLLLTPGRDLAGIFNLIQNAIHILFLPLSPPALGIFD
jgi:hypothetical protein